MSLSSESIKSLDIVPLESDGVPDDYSLIIKKLRSEFEFPQAGLAKRIGVSKKTIWDWENNKRKPTPFLWKRIVSIIKAKDFIGRYLCIYDYDIQKEMLLSDFYPQFHKILESHGFMSKSKISKVISYGADRIIDGDELYIDDVLKILVKLGYKISVKIERIE